MIPGTQSIWVSHLDWLFLAKRGNRVDNKCVGSEIAAADNVAGPRAGQLYSMLIEPLRRKERMAIRVDDELRGALARTVRILPTHGIAFPITPYLLLVLVAFVTR